MKLTHNGETYQTRVVASETTVCPVCLQADMQSYTEAGEPDNPQLSIIYRGRMECECGYNDATHWENTFEYSDKG